jgi:hypothetical protein
MPYEQLFTLNKLEKKKNLGKLLGHVWINNLIMRL